MSERRSSNKSGSAKGNGNASNGRRGGRKPLTKKQKKYMDYKNRQEPKKKGDPLPSFSEDIRLNKFLSNAGICSRREADVLIGSGVVEVNGEVVTELGYKVKPTDNVKYGGESIRSVKKQYVILNKPKNVVAKLFDKKGRKTVKSFIKKACKEHVYPLYLIEPEDTGLMLFSNDTDLMKKLQHPNSAITSLFHVTLDRPMTPEQLVSLNTGVDVESRRLKVENAEFVEGKNGREIGVEVRSNRHKQIRKMLKSLGLKPTKMDLVMYAGITKKDLPRGYYRYLSDKELSFLKMK